MSDRVTPPPGRWVLAGVAAAAIGLGSGLLLGAGGGRAPAAPVPAPVARFYRPARVRLPAMPLLRVGTGATPPAATTIRPVTRVPATSPSRVFESGAG